MAVLKVDIVGASASAVQAFETTAVAADSAGGSVEAAGAKAELSGGKFKSLAEAAGIPSALLGGWAALGIAAVGVGVAAIKLGEDMQVADTSIATAAGTSIKSATDIGNAFLATEGTSEFSGKTIAQAFAAVAGQLKATEGQALSTGQAMTVMGAAQDLATAKQISLGDATSTLSGVMQAFQLPVSDAATAANVLFNASNATGQSVDSLGSALERTRSRLGAAAPPLSALAALMVDMTNSGITGRAALTGVTTAMTGLIAAAGDTTTAGKAAESELQSLGVSAVTSTGQLTPMSDIITALGPKFAAMSQAQQLATASTIFGTSAAKAMVAVIDGGPAAFDAATASVTKTGAAQQAASAQSKTLSVEMNTLRASVSDIGTQLGQVLIPILAQVAKALGEALPIAIGVVRTAFRLWKEDTEAQINVIKDIITIGGDVVSFIAGSFTKTINTFKSAWDAVWTGIKATVQDVWNIIKPIFDSISSAISSITSGISAVSSAASDVGKAVTGGYHLGPIPLASGGIVNQPTLAVVGEAGPEAVIPLSMIPHGVGALNGGSGVSSLPSGIAGAASGHTINVNVQSGASPTQIGTEVSWALKLAS